MRSAEFAEFLDEIDAPREATIRVSFPHWHDLLMEVASTFRYRQVPADLGAAKSLVFYWPRRMEFAPALHMESGAFEIQTPPRGDFRMVPP